MRDRTKNIISAILPLVTIVMISLAIRTQPTGFAVYENKTLYRIKGSVSITLQEKIPLDSYVTVKIDDYETKMHLLDFIKMSKIQNVSEYAQEPEVVDESGRNYRVMEDNGGKYIIGKGIYNIDFTSLGIINGFEKGKHVIKTEIIYGNSTLYSNENIIEV